MVAAFSALVVTLVTMLGGMGLLPAGPAAASDDADGSARATLSGAKVPDARATPTDDTPDTAVVAPALPAGSGEGRRVVFDMSDQRVWLVEDGNEVARTYPVSGSLTDNLRPGTYAVYSTSRWATGVDDSGVMQYFVRFTHGARAAIGFHSVPTKNGRLLERRDQLGTPQSHGCIRQWLPDAKALWDFAPVGTKVVVTA
jgi:L,D-transpeptidase-like protein